jgi:hypothetical protein
MVHNVHYEGKPRGGFRDVDSGMSYDLQLLPVIGHGINNPNHLPAMPQTQAFWYQWFFQTQQATLALERDRRGFCEFIWYQWPAPGYFTQPHHENKA